MNSVGVILIILIAYLIAEIYKFIFKNKQEYYKLIPIIVTIVGGIVSIIIYFTDKTILFNVTNMYEALLMGFISGASATGTNQIIKKIFNKGDSHDSSSQSDLQS